MGQRQRTLEISLSDDAWRRIDRLAKASDYAKVEDLIGDLLDHVQRGVETSEAWQRGWLEQCFGDVAVSAAYAEDEAPL